MFGILVQRNGTRDSKQCNRNCCSSSNRRRKYFLRILLTHVKAPMSFDDLKIVNGVYTNIFREVAILKGYFESDNSQEKCLPETSLCQIPYNMRRLFAHTVSMLSTNKCQIFVESF